LVNLWLAFYCQQTTMILHGSMSKYERTSSPSSHEAS
jgi:hypothetical protein